MNKYILLIIFCVPGISVYTQSASGSSDYYEQAVPGDIPVVFAPGVISRDGSYEYPCSFTNDMSEMYFGVNLYNEGNKERYILHVKKQTNGEWYHPEIITFTGYPESEPILSPDNSLLFFNVHTDTSKWKPHDIWYVEKNPNGWSQPERLNGNINSDDYEYFTTMTQNKTIYFTREGKGIYTADFFNNDFQNIKPVDSVINKMKWAGHPYISPDESYLIFDSSEPGGFGSADLYISFKADNHWSEPINLGAEINSSQWDAMPIVSPDGKFLFFCRQTDKDRDVYWVRFDLEKYKHSVNK
ncbi:MAG: hypothetical protein GF372_11150 [Candidatus Marinimicrobia bacterium]|nr:hypothetical protein [Candidatus Neomarinimicrobiota bacterium]